MEKYRVWLNIFAVVIVGAFLAWLFAGQPKPEETFINDFKKCAAAGYPIMESYPRQCRTPHGEVFVEPRDVVYECTKDSECKSGQFCNNTRCEDFVLNTSCQSTNDCKLVNQDLNFSCCWQGVCDAVDYSQTKWVAVNRSWYESVRSQACSSQQCGAQPLCPLNLVNDNFEARCVGAVCLKLPVAK